MKQYRLFLFFALHSIICSLQAQNGKPLLKFIENKGQWDQSIHYGCDLPKGNLYLQSGALLFNFHQDPLGHLHGHVDTLSYPHEAIIPKETSAKLLLSTTSPKVVQACSYKINFKGASPNVHFASYETQTTRYNYFHGNNPARWGIQATAFNKISYQNLYEGVHLDLYEVAGNMKYEFILKAGINPSKIVMNYEGVEHLYVQQGELHVLTPVSHIIDSKPFAYQYIKGQQVVVPCEFEIKGHDVSFRFPKGYNANFPLVIDPKLIFSSYSGSTADNWGNTAAFDNAGHLYSGGIIFYQAAVTTVGSYIIDLQGDVDVLILKYSVDGSNADYVTLIGGGYSETPASLVVNNQNELLVLGTTSSDGSSGTALFPVSSGAYQTIFAGGNMIYPLDFYETVLYPSGSDLFIAKLDINGVLQNATFLGGSDNDGLLYSHAELTKNYGDQYRGDILIDKDDNIYVASHTHSIDFPTTAGVIDNTMATGDMDGVIIKMSPDLSTLIWATYLGGDGLDATYSIQLDSVENVIVAGGTTSANFPVTTGAYLTNYAGAIDGFICYLQSDAQSIHACTYLGTTSYDQVYFVQLDTSGYIYALGQTLGAYPVSSGVYSNANGKHFIHKFDKNLTTTIFSSVFGTSSIRPNITPTAFLVNECENLFVAGWGGSVNRPSITIPIFDSNGIFIGFQNINTHYLGGNTIGMYTTPNAFDTNTDGSDFYLAVFPKDMIAPPLYATFMGGNLTEEHVDGGTSRFDKRGIVYQAVCANCGGYPDDGPTNKEGFPVSYNPNAWSLTNNSSNCNNAAFKFDLANLQASFIADTLEGCNSATIHLTNTSLGGVTFSWRLDGVEFSTSSTTTQISVNTPGDHIIQLIATDEVTCIGGDTVEKIITIHMPPPFDVNVVDTIICFGDTIQLIADNDPDYIYQWTPNKWISNTTIYNPEVWPDSTITYYLHVTDENGCEDTDTVNVKVAYISANTSWENLTDCLGTPKASFKNASYGPLNYLWNFGDGQTSTSPAPSHTYENPGSYQVTVDISNDGCADKDTINIVLEPVKVPNLMTRNGDGLNDLFKIQGITKDWHVEIYNRWGKPLYRSDNYPNDWAGEDLSDGIYYYLIITPEGTECKGWVHLMK